MHANKLISINANANFLLYEAGNDTIAKINEPVYFVVLLSNVHFEINTLKTRFELPETNASTYFCKMGFVKISDTVFVNANYIRRIHLDKKSIELHNNLRLSYSDNCLPNIENYLGTISVI